MEVTGAEFCAQVTLGMRDWGEGDFHGLWQWTHEPHPTQISRAPIKDSSKAKLSPANTLFHQVRWPEGLQKENFVGTALPSL